MQDFVVSKIKMLALVYILIVGRLSASNSAIELNGSYPVAIGVGVMSGYNAVEQEYGQTVLYGASLLGGICGWSIVNILFGNWRTASSKQIQLDCAAYIGAVVVGIMGKCMRHSYDNHQVEKCRAEYKATMEKHGGVKIRE